MKNFDNDDIALKECRFVFVFCPNNSGSTVLSQYLASQVDGYLPPFGSNEGQMAPSVKPMMRNEPWSRDQRFDWKFIRREWEQLSQGKLFVEASPPNIMRPDQIHEEFGSDSTAIISICDPYQQIASTVRRYTKPGQSPAEQVAQWVKKAKAILRIVKKYPKFPFIRYEDFVANPRSVNELLSIEVRPFNVTGKTGSGGETIQDMSVRTTLFLTEQELDEISAELLPHQDVVERFRYEIVSGAELTERLTSLAGCEAQIAKQRRVAWENEASSIFALGKEKLRSAAKKMLKP